MLAERRTEARWLASHGGILATVTLDGGPEWPASVVDLSRGGIGLRIDHKGIAVGAPAQVALTLSGTRHVLPVVVCFSDGHSPRTGFRTRSPAGAEGAVRDAGQGDFVRVEIRGETLVVTGDLRWSALKAMMAAEGCHQVDLSGVTRISMAGGGAISRIAHAGKRILACSRVVADAFARWGICTDHLCVAKQPCHLGREALGREARVLELIGRYGSTPIALEENSSLKPH